MFNMQGKNYLNGNRSMKVFITNLGRYNEGYLVGKWVKLPVDDETLDKVLTEIGINETMIARTAKELYILADHTKLGNPDASIEKYGSCTYDRQVTLITDEKADPKTVESLRALGIEVCLVGLNDVNF